MLITKGDSSSTLSLVGSDYDGAPSVQHPSSSDGMGLILLIHGI